MAGSEQVNTKQIGIDWVVKPWSYIGKTVAGAFTDIRQAVDSYPPGQNGIDAGGAKVVASKSPESADDAAYLYVQFESERGYVDDLEFAVLNGVVNVRTSSRLGFPRAGRGKAQVMRRPSTGPGAPRPLLFSLRLAHRRANRGYAKGTQRRWPLMGL